MLDYIVLSPVGNSKKYIIKGAGLLENIEALKNIIVSYKAATPDPNSQQAVSVSDKVPVYLKDIAKVSFVNTNL